MFEKNSLNKIIEQKVIEFSKVVKFPKVTKFPKSIKLELELIEETNFIKPKIS